MTLTHEELINQVAIKGDIDVATVRKVFESTEDYVFAYLSSTTQSENRVVKLLDGLSVECKYVPAKKMHVYEDIVCKPKIWAEPKITRYYNRKLNHKS